jgi:hypothetical protein
VAAQRREVLDDAAEVVNFDPRRADLIETEQPVHEHDGKRRAARDGALDRVNPLGELDRDRSFSRCLYADAPAQDHRDNGDQEEEREQR